MPERPIMRAKQAATAGAHADSDLLPPIDVRVTQVNRGRLRLLQALVPMAGLLAALARGFDSLLALALLAILASVCAWLFISAYVRSSGQARALRGQIRLDRIKVRPGEFGQWRWYGQRAVIFELSGNVAVAPRSTADAEALRAMLQCVLGDPLRFRPRGSAVVRRLAAATGISGPVLMYVAFKFDIKPLWLVGILMGIGGMSVLGAFSQSVAESPNDARREQ